jgi:hypothetical protein
MSFLIYVKTKSDIDVFSSCPSIAEGLKTIKNILIEFIIDTEGKNKLETVFVTEEELKNINKVGFYIVENGNFLTLYRKYKSQIETNNWLLPNQLVKNIETEEVRNYFVKESKYFNKNNLEDNFVKSLDNDPKIMSDLEMEIIKFLVINKYIYLPIDNESSIKKIHNLLINDQIFEPELAIEMQYLGFYYNLKNDYTEMEKYYLMGIRLYNNKYCILSLNLYYKRIGKPLISEKTKPVVVLSDKEIELIKFLEKLGYGYLKIDCEKSINNIHDLLINEKMFESETGIEIHYLGIYYDSKKEYELMIKYFLMAIDNKYYFSGINLGQYYKSIGNYNLMKKYLLMAIDDGLVPAMILLSSYYETIEFNEQLRDKYLLMAIRRGNKNAMVKYCADEFEAALVEVLSLPSVFPSIYPYYNMLPKK